MGQGCRAGSGAPWRLPVWTRRRRVAFERPDGAALARMSLRRGASPVPSAAELGLDLAGQFGVVAALYRQRHELFVV